MRESLPILGIYAALRGLIKLLFTVYD